MGLFHGKGLVIVSPNEKGGVITLEASADGLKNGILKIKAPIR